MSKVITIYDKSCYFIVEILICNQNNGDRAKRVSKMDIADTFEISTVESVKSVTTWMTLFLQEDGAFLPPKRESTS